MCLISANVNLLTVENIRVSHSREKQKILTLAETLLSLAVGLTRHFSAVNQIYILLTPPFRVETRVKSPQSQPDKTLSWPPLTGADWLEAVT